MPKKKIIITGGAGFIGSNAASRYLHQGHQVVLIDNLSRTGTERNLEWLRPQGALEFCRADIRDAAKMDKIIGRHSNADLILHLAAQVAVTTSVTNPREDFEINALGSLNVLEAARKADITCPILYSSTNKVYGALEDFKVVDQGSRYAFAAGNSGVPENYPLDFHSPYGCSKGAADQYFLDYHRIYGLKTVVLRQSCIYGYRQFGVEDQGWIAWFMIAAAQGRPVTIFGDGKQVRDALFIEDLVDMYDAVAHRIETAAGRVYNAGGGPGNTLSLLDLLSFLRQQDSPVSHEFAEWRPGDQRVYISDISRAQSELGWKPATSVEMGLMQLHQWVARNSHLFGAKRRRLVHVGKFYPPHMGGIETHLQTLARQQAKENDVEALVANDGPETVTEMDGGVRVKRLATRAVLASAPVCLGLPLAIRRAKPDVLHLHLPNPLACLSVLASGYRGPVVTTYHSDVVRQKLLGRLFEPFLRLALWRSSAILCTSQRYLETSKTAWRFRHKCAVVPYGIPPVGEVDRAMVESIRRSYGPRIVLAVGRLVSYKGFEYLVSAMRHVDGALLIIGDGPLRAELQDQIVESRLCDRVHLLGEIQNEELGPYYRAADVFALSSVARSEAFGIVQLEAMAHGLPVVNTALDSGVPSVSLHKETGMTAEPRNAPSLAHALNEVLSNRPLRAKFSAAARERAGAEFTQEVMLANTMRVYDEVLAGTFRPTEPVIDRITAETEAESERAAA